MKPLLVIILASLFINNCYSREPKHLYIKIDSTTNSKNDILNNNFHVTTVLDSTCNTDDGFGYIRSGFFNKKTSVKFENSLTYTTSSFIFSQKATYAKTAGSIPVIMVIKKVQFKEIEYGTTRIPTVLLEVDYYNSNKILIYSTINKDVANYHVTMKKTDQCTEIFKQCICKSLQALNFYDKNKISKLSSNKNSLPILKEKLKAVFYGSFLELKNNSPQFLYDFQIQNKDDKKYQKRGLTDDLVLVINDTSFRFNYDQFMSTIYGFCDGKNIYVRDYADGCKFGFVELTPVNRYSLFKGKTQICKGSAVGAGYVIGGVIGAAVTSVAYKGVEMDFIIDLMTGETYFYSPEDISDIITQTPDIQKKFNSATAVTEDSKGTWLFLINNAVNKRKE